MLLAVGGWYLRTVGSLAETGSAETDAKLQRSAPLSLIMLQ